MPDIPVTWRQQQTANTVTAGTQDDPTIVQLANGNILVSWTSSSDAGAGSTAGLDVVGQIFDPLGGKVGGEFRINVFGNAADESDMDIAAVPGGGFIAVYERVTGGVTTLCLDEYDANGVRTTGSFVVDDIAGDPAYANPRIAASSGTSALIVYEEITAGVSRIRGKVYNASTDTYGSESSLIAFLGNNNTNPDVTALTNGNYVITANVSGADSYIGFRIVSSTGSNVLGATIVAGTNANGFTENEAAVAALSGGGFVIAYKEFDTDLDIQVRVYNAAGVQVASTFAGVDTANSSNSAPVVAGLASGGFVVVFDNDQDNRLDVTHFSAAGIRLGTFTIAANAASTPVVTDLDDGRFSVAWSDSSGEISMAILDTRDAVNAVGVYTPDQWQVGTIGADAFIADGVSEFVHGGDGDDTITESGQTRQYFGDAGNDTIIVNSLINADLHDGGGGVDTIDWSVSFVMDGVFNLAAGTATSSGATEQMLNFENWIGTDNADAAIGTAAANVLTGAGGADTLDGGAGADSLVGGTGNDVYFVDDAGDIVAEAAGDAADEVRTTLNSFTLGVTAASANVENLTFIGSGDFQAFGSDGANSITGGAGVDNFEGGLGADTLVGGANTDNFIYRSAAELTGDSIDGGSVAGNTAASGPADVILIGFSGVADLTSANNVTIQSTGTTSIEKIALFYGGGHNVIFNAAQFGATGIAANLFIQGDAGADVITINNVSGAFTAAAFGFNIWDAAVDRVVINGGLNSADSITGSRQADVLTAGDESGASQQNDTLLGGDGDDTISGGYGFDSLDGGAGTDTGDYTFGGVALLFTVQWNMTTGVVGFNGGSSTERALNFENALMGTSNDSVTGTGAANLLNGGGGADTLTGGGGNDALDGGAGSDTALYAGGRASFYVRSVMSGGQFQTTVVDGGGGEGTDTLLGIETLGFNGGAQAFGLAGVQQNRVSNMDGSLYDDVLFQNTATGQVTFANMTAGVSSGFQAVLGALPAGWRAFDSADVTGDGRAEAFVQDTNTGSIYHVNIASGGPVWGVVNTSLTSAYQAIATGDLTRDGTADVLVRDSATGQLFIADIDAGGGFGGWLGGPNLGLGWRTVGLGDFNRDGASDILVQNIADGTTYYRDVANGAWGFVSGALGTQWTAREAADLNGDGFCDVVFQNTATSDIWYVNMLGGANAGWGVVANAVAGWQVRGSADVDNDGYRDVMIQNTANGTTYYADMNAGAFAGWGVVSGALGTQWTAIA